MISPPVLRQRKIIPTEYFYLVANITFSLFLQWTSMTKHHYCYSTDKKARLFKDKILNSLLLLSETH